MRDIKNKSVFVQVIPDEALASKRDLLEIELHLLDILRTFLSIKEFRKLQLKIKRETRKKMGEITTNINKIFSCLPVEEALPKKLFKEKEEPLQAMLTKPEAEEKVRIEAELREIRKKLEKLD